VKSRTISDTATWVLGQPQFGPDTAVIRATDHWRGLDGAPFAGTAMLDGQVVSDGRQLGNGHNANDLGPASSGRVDQWPRH
jgi:hypothetical protein